MADTSPYTLARRLEADVHAALAAADTGDMSPELKQQLSELKHGLTDARLDIRDYELAETRLHQQRFAQETRARLESARQLIVATSQHGVFGAIDVAHLSAQIAHIIEQLT